ncbi:MAG: hypothetical protein M3Z10_13690 [Gemmatimonadota bacterium]|nr:hypothetical protein [Gemmatimonadota bacterium]
MTAPRVLHALTHEDSVERRHFRASAAPSHALSAAVPGCDPALTECPAVTSIAPSNGQGYLQPGPITIRFAGPVRSVTLRGDGAIMCSGSYGTLTGYDEDGRPVGQTDLTLIDPADCSPPELPDDLTYGAQATLETRSVMKFAIVSPMSPLQFLVMGICCVYAGQTYAVDVGSGNTNGIRIVRAHGPNPGRSFTFARSERTIVLQAAVTPGEPAPDVTWEIVDAPNDRVNSIPPAQPPRGVSTSFTLPKHDRSRWPTDHPGDDDRKPLTYEVTALWTKEGETYRSDPVTVGQDQIDTIREEYYEFGLTTLGRHIPTRDEFVPSPRVRIGANNGDYPYAVLEPAFMAKLVELNALWAGAWQLNTIYRNPNHNLNGHISSKNKSKPSPVTWHMWGCAADLQTFPADGSDRQYTFWHALNDLAVERGWDTEDLVHAKVGHVHVELDCP